MIKVLIVDDSTFIRKMIRQALERDTELQVVGEAADGREALDQALALKPDVITLDIIMPAQDGLWALEEINKKCPTPVIVFSSISTVMAVTPTVRRMISTAPTASVIRSRTNMAPAPREP